MIRVSRGVTDQKESEAVRAALECGYYGLAEKVNEFENDLAAYLGAENVIAVNSCTSALHLSLDALSISDGDEVIVPSLTFVGSFQAISATGAKPVPCDVYPNTLLMDIDDIKKKITEKTKAIMPVHYTGNPCEMDLILEIARSNNLRVVEDAAHALGSYYKNRKSGSFGDVVCFSFDSIKNITCGEGGAIVCQDADLDALMRQKRLVGIDRKSHTAMWKDRKWEFDVKTQGFRYHMSNINAAIGIEQLKKLDGFIERRRQICKWYDIAFSTIEGLRLLEIDYDTIASHIYVVRVESGRRDDLMDYLKEKNIETGINYVPAHSLSFYKDPVCQLPVTEQAYREILTLPLHCALSDDDVNLIIEAVKAFFKLR